MWTGDRDGRSSLLASFAEKQQSAIWPKIHQPVGVATSEARRVLDQIWAE